MTIAIAVSIDEAASIDIEVSGVSISVDVEEAASIEIVELSGSYSLMTTREAVMMPVYEWLGTKTTNETIAFATGITPKYILVVVHSWDAVWGAHVFPTITYGGISIPTFGTYDHAWFGSDEARARLYFLISDSLPSSGDVVATFGELGGRGGYIAAVAGSAFGTVVHESTFQAEASGAAYFTTTRDSTPLQGFAIGWGVVNHPVEGINMTADMMHGHGLYNQTNNSLVGYETIMSDTTKVVGLSNPLTHQSRGETVLLLLSDSLNESVDVGFGGVEITVAVEHADSIEVTIE